MSALKGNLYYPDEESIPPDLVHSELVSLAVPPDDLPWYADLYRLYEEVRLDMGLLTADDQLLTGWEMLSLHGSVLRPLQARFDCVIVDDFQDVNLAQAEILDMVAHPHLNYMVTGSDDQTLYAWRGAAGRLARLCPALWRAPVSPDRMPALPGRPLAACQRRDRA